MLLEIASTIYIVCNVFQKKIQENFTFKQIIIIFFLISKKEIQTNISNLEFIKVSNEGCKEQWTFS